MNGKLIRIVAPYFVAGIIYNRRNIVYDAAPILHYMVGWKVDKVVWYCGRKRWPVQDIDAFGFRK